MNLCASLGEGGEREGAREPRARGEEEEWRRGALSLPNSERRRELLGRKREPGETEGKSTHTLICTLAEKEHSMTQ